MSNGEFLRLRKNILLTVFSLAFIFSVVCATLFVKSFGLTFPSIFIDSYGLYSRVVLPSWGEEVAGLDHTSRIVRYEDANQTVDLGRVLYPGKWLKEELNQEREVARSEFVLGFTTRGQYVEKTFGKVKIGIMEMWAFGLNYFFAGWLYIIMGAVVYVLGMHSTTSIVYLFWTGQMFLFYHTFYDYHSTMELVPFFLMATMMSSGLLIYLVFLLPDKVGLRNKRIVQFLLLFLSCLILLSIYRVIAYAKGMNSLWIKTVAEVLMPLSMLAFPVGYLIRFSYYPSERKKYILIPSQFYLFWLPLIVLIGLISTLVFGGALFHLLSPFIPILEVLGFGYVIISKNLLSAKINIHKNILKIPVVILSVLIGSLTALMLVEYNYIQLSFHVAFYWAFSAFVSYLFFSRVILDWILPSDKNFRPILDHLISRLNHHHEYVDILFEVQNAVQIYAPKTRIQIELFDGNVQNIAPNGSGSTRKWEVPLFEGKKQIGSLQIFPHSQERLFSKEDKSFFVTVASVSSIALQHYLKLKKLVELQDIEKLNFESEKEIDVGVLTAEVAHEIKYPINFFNFILSKSKDGKVLSSDEVDIGRDELRRLESMVGSMGNRSTKPVELKSVDVKECILKGVSLLEGEIEAKRIFLSLDIKSNYVMTDADSLLQLFINLLRNAIQAVKENGQIHVGLLTHRENVVLKIRDNGPGVPEEIKETLFQPFVTKKEKGTGIGLAVCKRIAEWFEWKIDVEMENEMTCFRVVMPQ